MKHRDVADAVRQFVQDRDWEQFHNPKNLCMALASEAGELAAVLRWTPGSDADDVVAEGAAREQLLDEIGDVAIVLLSLCNRLNVKLDDVVRMKLTKNEVRYPIAVSCGIAERPRASREASSDSAARGQSRDG